MRIEEIPLDMRPRASGESRLLALDGWWRGWAGASLPCSATRPAARTGTMTCVPRACDMPSTSPQAAWLAELATEKQAESKGPVLSND
jgi:hypothetical protein